MAATRSLEALIGATQLVVQTTLNRELSVDSVEVKDRARVALLDYTTAVPLAGEVGGIFLMSLATATVHEVTRAFLGDDVLDGSDDLLDSMGELGNMIAGNAKSALIDTTSRFDITLPVTYTGTGSAVVARTGMPGSLAHCRLAGSPLILAVWRAKAD